MAARFTAINVALRPYRMEGGRNATAATWPARRDVVRRLFGAWRLGVVALVLLATQQVVHAVEPIRIVTEEEPPYNMLRDGRITGLGTEVVEAVMKQVGVNASIEIMPWARAYETALTEPNVLIYSMSRTAERESLFKWVGEVGPPERHFLYALATHHLHLKTLDEARAYRIATINGDVGEKYLLAKGFSIDTNLSRSNKFEASFEKLKAGRADLWLTGELTADYIVRSAGDDPALLLDQVLQPPNVAGADDRAAVEFGPHTSDALVQRFREGMRIVHENGTYDAIQRKWNSARRRVTPSWTSSTPCMGVTSAEAD